MKRVLLCIFWIGLPLFATGMGALTLAIADFEVPHRLLVWTLFPGMAAVIFGSLAFSKADRGNAARGFDVVQSDKRRAE